MLTVHLYACMIMLINNVHMVNLDKLDINNVAILFCYVQEVSVKQILFSSFFLFTSDISETVFLILEVSVMQCAN